ncbi:MAG: Sua5 family C-terminal domain-containing protein [Planctomycetaceae bacterium]
MNVWKRPKTTTCGAKFFAALRSLDSCGLDVIIAHAFPDHGLGIALNDVRRATCIVLTRVIRVVLTVKSFCGLSLPVLNE